MHLPSGAGVESSTLPDIPNSIYNGNGFDIVSDVVHNQGSNGICTPRKKIVIVGLGMVALSFIEKIIKLDAKNRQYDIVVIGEESHVAYNRVGLTSFFEHREVEQLYLNPKEWYGSFEDGSLNYHLNTKVEEVFPDQKTVRTSTGDSVSYDILVLATGSDAILPTHTPGYNANGVFVYRTISDLERLMEFASRHKDTTGVVIGGGLLGLEAAHAMMSLNAFKSSKLIDRNNWVLARQLDADAGSLVTDTIRQLGLDVMLRKRVATINTDSSNNVQGIVFEDGETLDCSCICFAIGVTPRDDLGQKAGIKCTERGGFIVDAGLRTSIPDIYAIGECASWENQTFGIIAPGIEMADVLSFNLTNPEKGPKGFDRPDLSTKLKLLGVNVASFGDFFADRDGPKFLPGRRASKLNGVENGKRSSIPPTKAPLVKALTYKDPFSAVYKKYLFTMDGKYLLGGMMIGDTNDYVKLNQMVKSQKELEVPPSQFILGTQNGGEENADDLDDDTQVCSCHNVTKRDVVDKVKEGSCKTIADVKSCTKAGTGCGGCMPLIQSIFNKTMKEMGQEVSNHLCSHIPYSRADLYNIVSVKQLKTFVDIMHAVGKVPDSLGCELCKPAIGSILASMYNRHVLDKPVRDLQDTNDKFLANIQRNGTFSVVPRVAGGEITADRLITIGMVAKKYNLYCKITGGQRIDMFGAKKQDLLDIWTELVNAGMESGHAYAKSLRTVKSCVGTTWCRFGVGDSVGMAIRLEQRYKSIRSPHKIKGGVSGCVRECAEAQNKDFGLIATEKGFNVFVGGNGGAKPRHSELLAKDVPPDEVVSLLDRYLIFYIRTADKLQRTARWIENLPGGIDYLREVVINDKLGICADLERQMEELVSSYFCEWAETIKDPERRKHFEQFSNTPETVETVEIIEERGQQRPTYWPAGSVTEDFKGHEWSHVSWQPILKSNHFSEERPQISSASIKRGDTQISIFKVKGKYYATQQMCPHKRAFVLSDGLIGDDDAGKYWVSCPLCKRNFELNGEQAGRCSNDETANVATFPAEERGDGWVYLKLPPVEELDALLGTEKWKVKKEEAVDPFEKADRVYKSFRGKKVADIKVEIIGKRATAPVGIDWQANPQMQDGHLLGRLMVRFFSGPLCDRYGPRLVFVGILLAGAVPTAMTGLVTNIRGLMALRFFIGILGASFVPCQVWTTGYFDKNVIGSANALTAGWGNAGGGITYYVMPAVFDSLVHRSGLAPDKAWRVAYIVPFIIIVVVALGMLFTCDDTPSGKWSDRAMPMQGGSSDSSIRGEIDTPSSVSIAKDINNIDEKRPQVISDVESQSDGTTYLDLAKSEFIVAPTTKEIIQVVISPQTIALFGVYACSFGTELAVNAILGSYYEKNFPHLGQTEAGEWAAMFGLLNVLFRPLGGIISDLIYKRTESVWAKKMWLIFLGVAAGAHLIAIGLLNPKTEATMFGLFVGLAVFMEAANGANFSLVPHVFPAANGIVSGTVGAAGNFGGLIFSIIFRYNGKHYDRSIWIIGVICIVINMSVFWIRPVPAMRK
ncbi:hypothetical protein V500_01260 [Pseudogymnoascus sp. VKM F-4518 (FW-2643)]|nr:hypothetical protein V500_01260 [Pseudogymnoascus sp. VKM F-4518 (FW-2643)]